MVATRTKPNLMSIILMITLFILAAGGIVWFFYLNELGVKIFIMILSLILLILSILMGLGSLLNYEEANDDKLIIHRLGKVKTYLISQISCIEFHGAYLRFMDLDNNEICNVSTEKANLLKLLEYLDSRGIEILDFTSK